MTPRAAEQLMREQLVINERTQEIGTVRECNRGNWEVLIDWCDHGLGCHPFNEMTDIKVY
jgi:hypothetical protein